MDELLTRRIVGLLTLILAALLLSWLLPRPGLHRLQGEGERVVTMDLTRPDSQPEEVLPMDPERSAAAEVVPPPLPPTEPHSGEAGANASEPQAGETEDADEGAAPDQAHAVDPTEPEPVVPLPAIPPRPVAPPKPMAEQKPLEVLPPTPAVKPAPKPEASLKPDPKPQPTSEQKPTPVTPPAEVAALPPPAKPVAAPKPAGAVTVQAGAYSFVEKAEGVRERAQAAGVSCLISPADTAKGTLYRLRCGPFADKAKADAAVQKLKSNGIAAQVVSGG